MQSLKLAKWTGQTIKRKVNAAHFIVLIIIEPRLEMNMSR